MRELCGGVENDRKFVDFPTKSRQKMARKMWGTLFGKRSSQKNNEGGKFHENCRGEAGKKEKKSRKPIGTSSPETLTKGNSQMST